MRIISLYQPYATLVVLGLKTFETRGWDTKYRGPLGIHATKGMPGWCKDACLNSGPFKRALDELGYTVKTLPRGQIIGQVELIRTIKTDEWVGERLKPGQLTELKQEWVNEWWFGDYSANRFAWELKSPTQYIPIPAKGKQGFWNFDL